MFGYAALACFMVFDRLNELCCLRFDPGYFKARATHLRLFFDRRKNDQSYAGHWVDVATAGAFRGGMAPANHSFIGFKYCMAKTECLMV